MAEHVAEHAGGRRRVLVAGCGDLGTALGLRLARRGDVVHGLRRDPSHLPEPLRPIAADLCRPDELADLPDVDVVAYCVAADERTEEAYRAAYVEGLRNLLTTYQGRSAAPRRVVFVSSTSVHGQDAGEEVDEDSPTEPARFTGRRVLEAEGVLRASGLPGVVARLTGIYGPGRTRLVDRVRDARATFSPGSPRWTNRIHRDDAVEALVHLAGLAEPRETYIVTDDEPALERDVLEWLAARLDAPAPVASDDGSRGVRGKRCSNARLRATGWSPRHPSWREGYEDLLGSSR